MTYQSCVQSQLLKQTPSSPKVRTMSLCKYVYVSKLTKLKYFCVVIKGRMLNPEIYPLLRVKQGN